MKYKISALATTVIDLGEYEANTKEEAIQKALDEKGNDCIPLCWHCSRSAGELLLSDRKEDIYVEEI